MTDRRNPSEISETLRGLWRAWGEGTSCLMSWTWRGLKRAGEALAIHAAQWGVNREQFAVAGVFALRFGPTVLIPVVLVLQAGRNWPAPLGGVELFGWGMVLAGAGVWGTRLTRIHLTKPTLPPGILSDALAWSGASLERETLCSLNPVLGLILVACPPGIGLGLYGLIGLVPVTAVWLRGTQHRAARPQIEPDFVPRPLESVGSAESEFESDVTDEEEQEIELAAEGSEATEPNRGMPGLWMLRTDDPAEGPTVRARAVVEIRAGARSAVVHVPLSPPWRGSPTLRCRVIEGDVRTISVVSAFGARIELKRTGDLTHPLRVTLELDFVEALATRQAA